MTILDILAKRLKADFTGVEAHFRRPQQAVGVVDQADHAQRRRMLAALFPDTQGLKRCDRAAEQRGGAVVRGAALGHQHGFQTGTGQGDGRCQSCRTAADHDHFGRICVHPRFLTRWAAEDEPSCEGRV